MIRRPPRSTQGVSSAASDVYKRQPTSYLQRVRPFRTHSRSIKRAYTSFRPMPFINFRSTTPPKNLSIPGGRTTKMGQSKSQALCLTDRGPRQRSLVMIWLQLLTMVTLSRILWFIKDRPRLRATDLSVKSRSSNKAKERRRTLSWFMATPWLFKTITGIFIRAMP